jgi:hypothetical protein
MKCPVKNQLPVALMIGIYWLHLIMSLKLITVLPNLLEITSGPNQQMTGEKQTGKCQRVACLAFLEMEIIIRGIITPRGFEKVGVKETIAIK